MPPARIRAACTRCGSSTANTCTWRAAPRTFSRGIRTTTSSTASSTCAIPRRPVEAGRWWLPGTREGDSAPPPQRLDPKFDAGFRAHNTNVFPQRPDRAYIGYIDGGAVILDIADKAHPEARRQLAAIRRRSTASRHTVLPLFERDLLIVSDECVKDDGVDWPKLVWVVDARVESNLVPISTLPAAPHCDVRASRRPLRRAQPARESAGARVVESDQIVIGTFFNAGVRAYDIGNPYQPQEVAYFVPGAPALSRAGAIQLNDVYVDDRRIVYTVDRFAGGLYILEMTL